VSDSQPNPDLPEDVRNQTQLKPYQQVTFSNLAISRDVRLNPHENIAEIPYTMTATFIKNGETRDVDLVGVFRINYNTPEKQVYVTVQDLSSPGAASGWERFFDDIREKGIGAALSSTKSNQNVVQPSENAFLMEGLAGPLLKAQFDPQQNPEGFQQLIQNADLSEELGGGAAGTPGPQQPK